MIKGTIYLDSEQDTEHLVTLLTNNDYVVQTKRVHGFDLFSMEYQIKYKRKDEFDEP
jgi:hypothetical protein